MSFVTRFICPSLASSLFLLPFPGTQQSLWQVHLSTSGLHHHTELWRICTPKLADSHCCRSSESLSLFHRNPICLRSFTSDVVRPVAGYISTSAILTIQVRTPTLAVYYPLLRLSTARYRQASLITELYLSIGPGSPPLSFYSTSLSRTAPGLEMRVQ